MAPHCSSNSRRTPKRDFTGGPIQAASGKTTVRAQHHRSRSGSHWSLLTAVPEVDGGLTDGLKVGANLRVGVEIGHHLIPNLIPWLALEAGEIVVHVRVGGEVVRRVE